MVQGIIIPADNTAPLTVSGLDSIEDHQLAVGGWIEAVDIPDLGVTMYVNEEGLIRDLPLNRRATFLRRLHVPQARDARLVGDVALVGLTDSEGGNAELPSELERRLIEPGVYRVRTRRRGGSRWHEEPIDRDDYIETVIWAIVLRDVSPTMEVCIECVNCERVVDRRREREPRCNARLIPEGASCSRPQVGFPPTASSA